MKPLPKIEEERKKKGISGVHLAGQLGVTYRTYYNWVTGRTDIPASALAKIAQMLGMSMDDLWK